MTVTHEDTRAATINYLASVRPGKAPYACITVFQSEKDLGLTDLIWQADVYKIYGCYGDVIEVYHITPPRTHGTGGMLTRREVRRVYRTGKIVREGDPVEFRLPLIEAGRGYHFYSIKSVPHPSTGDINLDGKLGVPDAVSMLRHVLGLEARTKGERRIGDVDRNGVLDFADVRKLLGKI